MLKNLKIEWLKLRSYRTFWVLSILFVVCLIGINYIIFDTKSDETLPPQASMLFGHPFNFPEVWQSVTYVSSFLLFLPGLLVLISITNEYSYKTHRQNIIDGMSRMNFVVTKILLAVIASLIATILTALLAIILGSFGTASFSLDKSIYVFYFFVQGLTYTLFGVLFGFLLKRPGIAISLYFVYLFFIKNILWGIIRYFTKETADYLPIKSSDALISFPFFRVITKQILESPNMVALTIASVIYIGLFCFLVINRFTKSDL